MKIDIYICLLLLLYSSIGYIPYSYKIKKILNSISFQLLIMSLIAYTNIYNSQLSLMIGISYIISLANIKNKDAKLAFKNMKEFINYEEYKSYI